MSNKSLSKLTRSELLDLLYEQEKRVEELEKRNKQLQAEVEDRKIKLSKVGSIADASMALSNVFAEAQKAVDLYLENVQGIVREKKVNEHVFPAKKEVQVQKPVQQASVQKPVQQQAQAKPVQQKPAQQASQKPVTQKPAQQPVQPKQPEAPRGAHAPGAAKVKQAVKRAYVSRHGKKDDGVKK